MIRLQRYMPGILLVLGLLVVSGDTGPLLQAQQDVVFPPRTIKIPSSSLTTSATTILADLQQLPKYRPGAVAAYPIVQANPADNSLIVTYTDPEQLRDLRADIRLVDVLPQQFTIHAEGLIKVTDSAGHEHQAKIEADGQTVNEHPIELNTTANPQSLAAAAIGLIAGNYSVRVHPRMNGNGTVDLNADWKLDCSWRVAGAEKPLRLHNDYTGVGRVADGQTLTLTRSKLHLSGEGSEAVAEIVLQLTPHFLHDKAPADVSPSEPVQD
ncbi:MAG TPA: hypothetical protein VFA07_02370 [Chthonomonadaceae bacterium]|nr:hypothetical protein [Chthonomonadaceae bacterium]